MSTIFKDYSTGCARSLVIRGISVLIVVPLACVFIFVPLWLVASLDMSIWVLIISSGLFLAILFGGGALYVGIVLSRRKRDLDAIFTPLGLTGSPYQMFFRQYHGTMEGRQVDVYFYRGPVLQVDVSTPLQTRLGVTGLQKDTIFLSRLFNRQPLALDDLGLDLTVFASDEGWARSLLANPHVPDLLGRLTALESFFTRQQVILRPGALRLMFSGNVNLLKFEITPPEAQSWVDDAFRLVHIAEHLPAPQVIEEESSAERLARSLRNRNPYLVPAIAVAVLVGILACSAIIAVAVVFLAETG